MRKTRTIDRLREHYEIEQALANKLRKSTREERKVIYSSVYNELFRRVLDHPQLTKKSDPDSQRKVANRTMKLLQPLLTKESTFLEIGAGDCSLSFVVANHAKMVYAIDVSDEITRDISVPANFSLIIADSSNISVQLESIDIAYSNDLMEHLHPDDAAQQLNNIYKSLAPGGVYICATPHRFSGPHDISRYFDKIASGFHLKEYTYSELSCLFKRVGFYKVKIILGARGWYLRVRLPLSPFIFIERLLNGLPFGVRRIICHSLPLRVILGIRLIGEK